ncbi:MAG: hypothetical protein ACKV22_25075 [Bryobacteraceae bacterium]
MTTPAFEAFLARLYTDASARQRFLHNPHAEARNAGLTDSEVTAIAEIDKDALAAAALSFDRKRRAKPKAVSRGVIGRLKQRFR